MSSIYLIDYYANSLKSDLHQMNNKTKFIFFLLFLFSILFTPSLSDLFFIFLIIFILILLAHLPLLKIFLWSIYPLFFAALFALSQIKFGLLPLKTLFRAWDASLLMLLLIYTTPYPLFFSFLKKISSPLASVFFLSYRYFFLIIDEIQRRNQMMKIRGGYQGGIKKSLKNIGVLIANLLIFTFQKGEKLYQLLLVRGYRGKMFSRRDFKMGIKDFFLIGVGLSIFLMVFKRYL